jgi:hypothetical protein
MESNLPKEDLNLIAQIDARLKHYNLIAPIEQVEQPKKQEAIEQAYKAGMYPCSDEDARNYFNQTYKEHGK